MQMINEDVMKNYFNIQPCLSQETSAHDHNFLELAYVVRGTALHILNGMETTISKGNYFILDYGAVHAYKAAEGSDFEIINCLFLPEFIDKSLKKCRSFSDVVNSYMIKHSYNTVNISPANYIFFDDTDYIHQLLNIMLEEYELKRPGFYEIIRCRLIEIIIQTMRKSADNEINVSDEVCLYMMDYAEKNIAQKNILGTISERLNFSPAYLSRRFKNHTGGNFSSYVQKIRIEYACRLLSNTDKKIIEIAHLCGYSDIKFFNEIYKKCLGITPGEFRRSLL